MSLWCKVGIGAADEPRDGRTRIAKQAAKVGILRKKTYRARDESYLWFLPLARARNKAVCLINLLNIQFLEIKVTIHIIGTGSQHNLLLIETLPRHRRRQCPQLIFLLRFRPETAPREVGSGAPGSARSSPRASKERLRGLRGRSWATGANH